MTGLLSYLIQAVAASGIFYGYYCLALRNRKFHQYNRFYLLLAVVVSLLVPFLNIPVYFQTEQPIFSGNFSVTRLIIADGDNGEAVSSSTSWLSLGNVLSAIYALVGFLLFIKIIRSLLSILKIIKSHRVKKIGDINWLNTAEPGTPYSFFRWLFWNNKLEPDSDKGRQIFRHELFHIRQKHSLDILFMELVTMLFWINPFYHLMKRELKAIHEFLADEYALGEEEKWSYAEMLLMQVLGTKMSIVNPFFHNQIKRRIAMMTNPKKTSHQYLRQLLVLPVLAGVFMLFAFSYRNAQKLELTELQIDETPLTLDTVPSVVIVEGRKTQPKKQLNSEMLNDFKDENVYGVWVDGKRIKNQELEKYKSSHFADYNVTKLQKDAVDYGKYYFQVNLFTKKNKTTSEYESPLVATEKLILSQKGINDPLIVINGNVQEGMKLDAIPVTGDQISDVTILKNKTATDLYGEKGANGAIHITTKTPLKLTEVVVEGRKRNEQVLEVTPLEKKTEKENLQEKVVVGKKIFQSAEIEPQFPGGDAALRQFIQQNIDKSIVSKAPQGSYDVIIQMLIDEDGKISNLKPVTNFGHGLEEEAIRVMQKSPDWTPAIQNGKNVIFRKKIVVSFSSKS